MALQYLETYKTKAPAGNDIAKLIEAMHSGKVTVKRESK